MSLLQSNRKWGYLYLVTIFTLTFYGVWFWRIPMLHYFGMLIGLVLPIIVTPTFYKTKQFLLLVFYFVIVLFNFISGDSYFNTARRLIDEISALVIPMAIFYFYYITKDKKWQLWVLGVTIVILVWVAIATYIFDSTMPGIVRTAHGQLQIGEENVSAFAGLYRLGMSNYILPHALPAIIPATVIVIKNKALRFILKVPFILLLASVALLSYCSGATGPLLVGLFVLIISFVAKPGKTSAFFVEVVVLSIVILPFLFNDELMLRLLEWIDNLLGNEGHFHYKVLMFQDTIMYNQAQGDIVQRQDLYRIGYEAFFSNVFIGSQGNVGDHSALLNRLASLGLVGFIPYIALLIVQIKMILKQIPAKFRVYYYIGLIAAFFMLLSKGIATWEIFYFIFAFLPFTIKYASEIE